MADPREAPAAPLRPYLTADLPGCGGHLRERPEDFRVEELPRYEPCGHGEHLYLLVEKQGLATADVLAHLARVLGLRRSDMGHAGLKDARAVTRQWLSAHAAADPDPAGLEREGLRVLAVSRHSNKLRPGHLRGNRFALVVRGADPAAPVDAIMARLAREGFPNYFGEQRFGADGRNADMGRRLLRGEAIRGGTARLRFCTNAYQAALFNDLVALRLREEGALDRPLHGDLAVLHRNGAHFAVTEAGLAEACARAAAGEISPSAPLFGHKVPLATGRPGDWERALLAREGLQPADFRLRTQRLSPKGERRAVRAFPRDAVWRLDPEGACNGAAALHLEVTLDKGVYATSLLRELTKHEPRVPLG